MRQKNSVTDSRNAQLICFWKTACRKERWWKNWKGCKLRQQWKSKHGSWSEPRPRQLINCMQHAKKKWNQFICQDNTLLFHSKFLSSCTSWFLSQTQLWGTVLHIPPHHGEVLQSRIECCYQIAKWQQSPSVLFHLNCKGKNKMMNTMILGWSIIWGHLNACNNCFVFSTFSNKKKLGIWQTCCSLNLQSQVHCCIEEISNLSKVLLNKSSWGQCWGSCMIMELILRFCKSILSKLKKKPHRGRFYPSWCLLVP